MAKLLFFSCSLLYAANSPLFALLPSLVVSHIHGLLATFISGAFLSSLAHLAGFQACYLPGLRMSFYPSPEQPKVSPHIKVIIDLWLTSAKAFQQSND